MSSTDSAGYEFQLNVIFSDDYILIVNKPSGLPVDSSRTSVNSLLNELCLEFGETDLRIVNRVDQPVSGLVVVARNKPADAAMSELFRLSRVEKEYWAAVHGRAEKSRELRNKIFHDKRQNKSFVSEHEKSKESILNYENILNLDNYSLLKVVPRTGRHHQIRAQLGHAGHPIKGDVKYGARRGNKDRSIHLHARRLSFDHPFTRERVTAVVNPIQDAIWTLWPQQSSEL